MGLLRMGDSYCHPDTDIMYRRGIRYELDSIWDWDDASKKQGTPIRNEW